MEYLIKAEIDGVEVLQAQNDDTDDNATRIVGAQYLNNASNGKMEIGATASDSLLLALSQPWQSTFDGSIVKLFVAPVDGNEESLMSDLEDEVGDSTEYEVADAEDSMIDSDEEDQDDDEGEDLTEDDEEELASAELSETNGQFVALEGDSDTEDEDEDEEPDSDDVDPNTDEDIPEWHQVGVFYVTGQTTSDDGKTVTLKAYDGFILMNGTFSPNSQIDTIQNQFDDLRTQLADEGIVVDDFDYPEEVAGVTIDWKITSSYRQALGYLAGMVGCFAEFGEDGSVGFSHYSTTDIVMLESELLQYNRVAGGDMVVGEILCNDKNGKQILTSGDGQSISTTNPFMTQDILDNVLSLYSGLRFSGASIVASWDESIRSGQFVRVMSDDEYKSYVAVQNAINATEEAGEAIDEELKNDMNSIGKIVLITSQTVTFGGNATTNISATSSTEFDKSNVIQTLVGQSVTDSLNAAEEASKVATNYLTYTEEGGLFVSEDASDVTKGTAANIKADSFRILNNGEVASEFNKDGINFYSAVVDEDGNTTDEYQKMFKMEAIEDAAGNGYGGRLSAGDSKSGIELSAGSVSLDGNIFCNNKSLLWKRIDVAAPPSSATVRYPYYCFNSTYVNTSESSARLKYYPYLGFAIFDGYFVLKKAIPKQTATILASIKNGSEIPSLIHPMPPTPIWHTALSVYRPNTSGAKAIINADGEVKIYTDADLAVGAGFNVSGIYMI